MYKQIVDQEVCFSPICLLVVRFDPLLSLLVVLVVWALGTHAMQCNSCLHMSVTTFDLNGFNVFLHVCVSHRSAVSEATVSHHMV